MLSFVSKGEIAIFICGLLARATIAYSIYLDRVSGRGRPRDPERLRGFIASKTYHLLDEAKPLKTRIG